ncbi:MAG: YhcH/YjgK/YiaL family protein [Phycisphaerae bacterium]|nr:YhcH/YjgK/YiaL family protein [Phycisphaerae bacterium]
MIADHLNNASLYNGLDRRIAAGLELLKKDTVRQSLPGRYEIEGDALFYIVDEYQSKPFEQGRPEIHQQYLDIQYIASGTECIGYAVLNGLDQEQPYDSRKDVAFYKHCPQMSRIVLKAGMFAVFWPNEVHMPGCSAGVGQRIKKIVVKVRMERQV